MFCNSVDNRGFMSVRIAFKRELNETVTILFVQSTILLQNER